MDVQQKGDKKLTLRVKCKSHQNITMRDVRSSKKVEEFLRDLSNLTSVPHDQMSLLSGFPPKRIPYNLSMTIEALGIKNQETIIVEFDKSRLNSNVIVKNESVTMDLQGSGQSLGTYSTDNVSVPLGTIGVIIRKMVPADNSCLYSAVTFCITRLLATNENSSAELREVIATKVLSHPVKYNEGFLGKSNLEYVEWISRFDSSGGGIELAILSEFYAVEINVMDTQDMRINCFGEDKVYQSRIFLIYDGTHYDSLYLETYDGSKIVTTFPTSDSSIYDLVMDLAFQEHSQRQRQRKESSHAMMTSSSPAKRMKPTSVVDSSWELIDPNPDIYSLFMLFNKTYFWDKLGAVTIEWSSRMTLCAGLCYFKRVGRASECRIKLSLPLLKLRPRKDLVETLLHEMIHAYLFLEPDVGAKHDRDGHGPNFQAHMHRINQASGSKITIYHSFHDEVGHYKQHWWQCDGPCRHRHPFFGVVKRAMNRAPGPNDRWWSDHAASCTGVFLKVRGPLASNKENKKVLKATATATTSSS